MAASEGDMEAFRVQRMLANGSGGIDWAGLPLACEMYGVRDVETLIQRLVVIKTHRPPKDE